MDNSSTPALGPGNLLDPGNFVNAIEFLGENTPGGEASSKGALGQMQVLPSTAAAPGYGVAPAANNSTAEYNRVGRDLAIALLKNYGNPAIAAAAYNAGPGVVNHWLTTIGDPRTGKISLADWVSRIPYKETRNYVARVTGTSLGTPSPTSESEVLAQGSNGGLELPTQESPESAGMTSLPPGALAALSISPQAKLGSVMQLLHLARSLSPKWTPVQVDYNPFKQGS